MADDFCRVYDRFVKVNGLAPKRDKSKRRYHRDGRLSDAEVITIMILFHLGGYKCLKHFYLNEVCRNMTDLFPGLVSYNRFVELERKVVIPFILFVNRCCMGACTGISFVDSTRPARVPEPAHPPPQGIQGTRPAGAMFDGMVLRLQTASDLQRKGGTPELHARTGQC